jgi:CheY-like chemotaxis protein
MFFAHRVAARSRAVTLRATPGHRVRVYEHAARRVRNRGRFSTPSVRAVTAQRAPRLVGRPAFISPLYGVAVLLVEDHDDARDLFQSLLEYAGALVVATRSVQEAIALTRGVRVNVVVTDIGLRGEAGTWFVEYGRRHARFMGVPVIAVTGRDMAPSVRKMFDAVLEKPIDHEELVQTIARLVRL